MSRKANSSDASESRLVARCLGENVNAILVEVADVQKVASCNAAMELSGYEAMGEHGTPGRRYFRRDDAHGVRTQEVPVFQSGNTELARHQEEAPRSAHQQLPCGQPRGPAGATYERRG